MEGLLSIGKLEEAVKKMTYISAKRLGIVNERGLLKEDYFADITIFNPDTIADKATYDDPKQYTDAGYCQVVGEKLMSKYGRPSRILRFKPFLLF